MQALILQLWGEKDSRPHIAAYHFTIALGAFFAPLLGKVITPVLISEKNSANHNIVN